MHSSSACFHPLPCYFFYPTPGRIPDPSLQRQAGQVYRDPSVKAAAGIAQGNQITDSMSAGRTNERNAMYIRSLEASSVCDQLYKHLASSINAMEPGLWSPSALKNDKVYNHDLVANQKDSGGTGGLKVLQGGVWRKLKFERRTNASAQVLPKRRLPESRWIQHFIPHGYSSSVGGDGVETSVVDRESGIRTIPGRTPLSHERELGAHKGEDHLDENAEICEQNFAEDEALVE